MNDPLVMFFGAMMSLSFAICFAPQVYKIYKNKSSKNVYNFVLSEINNF